MNRSLVALVAASVSTLAACSHSPARSAWPEAESKVEVSVPTPRRSPPTGLPVAVPAIDDGLYLAHLDVGRHFGCSEGWSSSRLTGSIAVEVRGGTASVKLDLEEQINSASRRDPRSAEERSHVFKRSWAGRAESTGPGAFSASLTSAGCRDSCSTVELACRKRSIPIEAPPDAAADGDAGSDDVSSGASVEGLVCENVKDLVWWLGLFPSTVPLATGVGLNLSGEAGTVRGLHVSLHGIGARELRGRL